MLLALIGVGMLLFGFILALVTATSTFSLETFTALGIFVAAMGLILVIIEAKTKPEDVSENQGLRE